MVNPGPIRVCEIFLQPQAIKDGTYDEKDVRNLIQAMETFVKKCGFAVKLNQYVSEAKHHKFTIMIEKSYTQLETTVKSAVAAALQALEEKKKT